LSRLDGLAPELGPGHVEPGESSPGRIDHHVWRAEKKLGVVVEGRNREALCEVVGLPSLKDEEQEGRYEGERGWPFHASLSSVTCHVWGDMLGLVSHATPGSHIPLIRALPWSRVTGLSHKSRHISLACSFHPQPH